eukprot:1161765-Pelagomonas_calceolata.AAC.8
MTSEAVLEVAPAVPCALRTCTQQANSNAKAAMALTSLQCLMTLYLRLYAEVQPGNPCKSSIDLDHWCSWNLVLRPQWLCCAKGRTDTQACRQTKSQGL